MEGLKHEKNPAAVRAVEAGKTWEDRERFLLSNLEKKLRLMETFYSGVKRLKRTDDTEAVEGKMNNEHQRLLSATPAKTLEKYSRLADLSVKIGTAKADAPELASLRKEFWELAADEEARFVWIMAEMCDNVTNKFYTARHFEEHPEEVVPHINRRLQPEKPLVESDVTLEFDALNVYVLTEKDTLAALLPEGGDTVGLHLHRSPVSLVQRGNEVRATKYHESVHNLLDGAALPAAPRVRYLRNLLSSITHYERTGNAPSTLATQLAQLKEITPSKILDGNHEEMLSELQNIEAGGYWESPVVAQSRNGKPRYQEFLKAAEKFSTAGKYSTEIIQFLNQFVTMEKNSSLVPLMGRLRDGYIELFTETTTLIRTLSKSTRTSEESEALHLAFALFPPSKYRHIPKLMEKRFPKKKA